MLMHTDNGGVDHLDSRIMGGGECIYDTACMGLSLSRVHHAIFRRVVASFFCSTRAASILSSRPHIIIAVARSDGQGRRFCSAAEGLSLTIASTAAGCP
jgi:hypothetical protein